MCLVLVAWKAHPKYSLIVASNRDEYHKRPSALAHQWPSNPDITAGQDLEALGTWMGVTRSGRWAVVTNFREQTEAKEPKKIPGAFNYRILIGWDDTGIVCFWIEERPGSLQRL